MTKCSALGTEVGMKGLTQVELEALVEEISETLVGAQLQEVAVNDRFLVFSFYRESMRWLMLDLHNNTPVGLVYEQAPPLKKSPHKKPLGLFLNSHFKGRYLQAVSILKDFGRVFLLNFGEDRTLEVRLIPRQVNVLALSQGKALSWDKPLPLSPPPEGIIVTEARSLKGIRQEWEQSLKVAAPAVDPKVQWEKQKQKDLEKKRKALVEIRAHIQNPQDQEWRQVGLRLKELGDLTLLSEAEMRYVDKAQSLSWNIENAFAKAKQLAQKKEGARERLIVLEKEIQDLEGKTYSSRSHQPARADLMKQAEARGRKLHLESGAIVYCGKSAADNLALLRKAKAWDLWLHLKDYPGAHAIIHRQREQVISERELLLASEWVVKESFASKNVDIGARLDLVIVECRFVRPLKGDKLGRVTYHSEKTYSFTPRQ